MSSSNSIFYTISYALSYLLIFILAIFLCIFLRIKERSYDLFMMIILNISCLLWPILRRITPFFVHSQFSAQFMISLASATYTFSLFWAASFAMFTYSVLNSTTKIFNCKRFIKGSFLVSLGVALLYPIT